MTEVILLAILDVFVIGSLLGYLVRERGLYKKRNLLRNEIRLTRGLIVQQEVDIEVSWEIFNTIQKAKEEIMKEIEENNQKIEEIRKGEPLKKEWREEIKELMGRNLVLGETNERAKNNDRIWRGEVLKKDVEMERYHSEIIQDVGKREYLKIKLKALLEMRKKGCVKNFEDFQLSELAILENEQIKK